MIFRVFSVWIAVAAAAAVSFFASLTAEWLRSLIYRIFGNDRLPVISTWFYSPSSFIYWFPIPLLIWAILFTFIYRRDPDHASLLRSVCFSCIAVFISAYIFAMILPFMPMPLDRLIPKQ